MISYVMNVEADEIAYRAAFACQKQGYKLHPAHGVIIDYANEFTKTQIVAEELKNDGAVGVSDLFGAQDAAAIWVGVLHRGYCAVSK